MPFPTAPLRSSRPMALALLAAALTAAHPAVAEPPRVVEVEPADGEVGVDPRLAKIRVVFDQEMDPGGYSFVGAGPRFPAAARPRWVDRRTCVLPVRLEPDHVYVFSLNSERHRNFRNLAGQAAEPYPVVFKTGPDLSARTTPEINRRALAELRRGIDERYSHRDVHGVDWQDLFAGHAAVLTAAPSSFAFARRAAEVLQAAEDVHIQLRVEDVPYPTFERQAFANFNLAILAKRVPSLTPHGQGVISGRFDDGVGYLFIPSWRPGTAAVAVEALGSLLDTRALILDVRSNSGGSEEEARRVAGRFVTEPRVYARHQVRDPEQPGGFSEPRDRILEPSSDRRYSGEAAVLMGPVCLSSNEAFLLMMKQAPRAVLVGARSYGASGNAQPLELGNGVTVYLPIWRTLLPDGSPLEGHGVEPDLRVAAGAAEFLTTDPVLEKALQLLAPPPSP